MSFAAPATEATSASLPALADEIVRSLAEVTRLPGSLAEPDAENADIAAPEHAARRLSEVHGALLLIDEQGLAALVQLLRAQLLSGGKADAVRAADAALAAHRFCSVMRDALERLLHGHRPVAGELLPLWQQLSSAAPDGASELHPSVLVSLQLDADAVPALPPALPAASIEFEPALLAFLRAQDDAQRADAALRIAAALAQARAQAGDPDERMRWLALRAYLIEYAQAGGDPARAKKIVAASARALRHVGQAGTVLASLAREALFELAQRERQSAEAREVARIFRLDSQFATPAPESLVNSAAGQAAAAFADVLATTIAAIETEPDKLVDAACWLALADAAASCAPLATIADAMRELAVHVCDAAGDAAGDREWLAATLLCAQACVSAGGLSVDGVACLAQSMREADRARSWHWLRQGAQVAGAHRLMLEWSSALRAEMTAAEQALDAVDAGEPARQAAMATLTQIVGALQLLGLDAERDAVQSLRALLEAAQQFAAGDDTLALQWVRLQESFVLLPWRIRDSLSAPVAADIPARSLPDDDHDAVDEAGPSLDAIFIAEARGLLREMRAHATAPDDASLVHAAHTLAGCSSTVGATAIAELAHALEDALAFGPAVDLLLLADTLDALDAMLAEFAAGGRSSAASQLVERWRSSGLGLTSNDAPDTGAADDSFVIDAPVPDSPPIVDPVFDAMPATAGEIAAADLPQAMDLAASEPDAVLPELQHITAAQPAPAANEDPGSVSDGEAELLAIFNEEAADLLPQIEQAVRAWQRQPDDREQPARLLRVLHTLKGSARMAGRHQLGEDFHRAEAEVSALSQQAPAAVAAALPALLERVDGWLQSIAGVPLAIVAEAPALADDSRDAPPPAPDAPSPLLRVRADRLAQFADSSAEIWTGNARLREGLQEQRRSVADLSDDLARLRAQLRELEIEAESRILSRAAQGSMADFDPLEFDRYTRLHELTRMMAESITDIVGVQRGLARQVEALGSAASAQARDLRRQQAELQALRSQALQSVDARLRHLLRQAAREAGREADLEIEGAQVEIERGLLDRLMGPLEHLLRNAVVHGIEPPDERVRLGKPRAGTVTIAAALSGNELRLSVRDDGRGLDLERIRERALAVGLLHAATDADARALAALVFEPGFSTASEVTALSGRGIGMDAVRVELQSLGGRIDIDSEAGRGCRFAIRLPASLASVQVILASAGRWRVALPATLLQQVLQLDPAQIKRGDDGAQIDWQGQAIRLLHLGNALGDATPQSDAARVPVAVLRDAGNVLALQLDAIEGQREVIVKHPGAQLAQVPGLAGATLLGDGGIALVIDPFRLPAIAPTPAPPVEARRAPLVLVVDDSLTVRRASQRLLERHGYAVALARDGVEALEQLRQQQPVAVLLDIEMPRMDGFELLAALRDDVRLRSLPVVMITSRIAERHRERAIALGATAYMGKPYDEDALLGLLAQLCVPGAAIA